MDKVAGFGNQAVKISLFAPVPVLEIVQVNQLDVAASQGRLDIARNAQVDHPGPAAADKMLALGFGQDGFLAAGDADDGIGGGQLGRNR